MEVSSKGTGSISVKCPDGHIVKFCIPYLKEMKTVFCNKCHKKVDIPIKFGSE